MCKRQVQRHRRHPGAEWQPDVSGVNSKAVLQGTNGFAPFLSFGSPLPTPRLPRACERAALMNTREEAGGTVEVRANKRVSPAPFSRLGMARNTASTVLTRQTLIASVGCGLGTRKTGQMGRTSCRQVWGRIPPGWWDTSLSEVQFSLAVHGPCTWATQGVCMLRGEA